MIRCIGRRAAQALTVARRPLYAAPGHYGSPIPSPRDVERAIAVTSEPYGVDLRADAQLTLADRLAPLAAELPTGRDPAWRWHDGPANRMFGQPDAGVYYAMIADRKPGRVVEVGSGFSSAVALDAADRHSPETRFTFVEPYPQRLLSLLTDADRARTSLRQETAQTVDLDLFTSLGAGDILFVDSTHVGKAGSDVLRLLLDVLPRLAPGVVVHVHDVFWPFTYPAKWLREGRGWNEAYLLRALLVEPSAFDIVLWGSWLALSRPEYRGAGSIWLERRP